jgi:hypothetical protein
LLSEPFSWVRFVLAVVNRRAIGGDASKLANERRMKKYNNGMLVHRH